MQEDKECIMVARGTGSRSQRVKGRREGGWSRGDVASQDWRHRGSCRADGGEETSSGTEFASEFYQE